jgi:hypothetical protein
MKEKKAQEPLLKWKAGSGKVTVKNGGGGCWRNDLALTYGGLFVLLHWLSRQNGTRTAILPFSYIRRLLGPVK